VKAGIAGEMKFRKQRRISMKLDIRRVWNIKLEKEQKEILEKYNLEIVKKEVMYTRTPNKIKEDYTIAINSIDDLIEIAKELDEELIINKNKSIIIYDDYIE
jgi:hypothetical protein